MAVDRNATIAEVARVLEEHVVNDGQGFESRSVDIDTAVLRDVLTLLKETLVGSTHPSAAEPTAEFKELFDRFIEASDGREYPDIDGNFERLR